MRGRSICGVAKSSVCAISVCVSGSLFAMGWFSNEPALRQTELTPAELKQLSIRSGWSSDDPSLMLFEVGNQNTGPVFCVGANFEFKDGKKRAQAFEPKLYIPSKAIRKTAIRGIEKKDVKTFGFSCLCMKASPEGPCENAFR
jgi:hypothetical protein